MSAEQRRSEPRERKPDIEQGELVWFDRGHGWEYGEVWAHGTEEVAISIGNSPVSGDPIERTVLPLSAVYTTEQKNAMEDSDA